MVEVQKIFTYDFVPKLVIRKMTKRWGSFLTKKQIVDFELTNGTTEITGQVKVPVKKVEPPTERLSMTNYLKKEAAAKLEDKALKPKAETKKSIIKDIREKSKYVTDNIKNKEAFITYMNKVGDYPNKVIDLNFLENRGTASDSQMNILDKATLRGQLDTITKKYNEFKNFENGDIDAMFPTKVKAKVTKKTLRKPSELMDGITDRTSDYIKTGKLNFKQKLQHDLVAIKKGEISGKKLLKGALKFQHPTSKVNGFNRKQRQQIVEESLKGLEAGELFTKIKVEGDGELEINTDPKFLSETLTELSIKDTRGGFKTIPKAKKMQKTTGKSEIADEIFPYERLKDYIIKTKHFYYNYGKGN
jgi:hypothetical protein